MNNREPDILQIGCKYEFHRLEVILKEYIC